MRRPFFPVTYISIVIATLLATTALGQTTTLDELIAPDATPQVLGHGYGFCEGPAADAEGNIYFSDGKNNTIHFYRPDSPVAAFVTDALDANGMMFNRSGELIVCQGAAFKVYAYNVKTKQRRLLADRIEEGRFNEPNDVAVDRSDGFYFTDPCFRHRGNKAVRKEDVYYCSPEGHVSRVSSVCLKPNGVLLSADGKTLYLADRQGQCIYKYDVLGPGRLTQETKWIDALGANPDGMTLDQQGNLFVCCNVGGVLVFDNLGRRIGRLDLRASNACFGGPAFKTLFLTCRNQFIGLAMQVPGIKPIVRSEK